MPAWIMHLKVAKEVNKKLGLDESKFLFGNVMVDAERHIIDNLSVVIPYDISHFASIMDIKNMKIKLPSYEKFLTKYKYNMDNPIVLGYYTHLLTDYFWNYTTFNNYFISDNSGNVIGIKLNDGNDFITDKETIRVLKQTDFEMYSRHIVKNIDFYINKENINEIIKDCEIIKEIPYSKQDIEKVVDYVDNIKDMYEKKDENETIYKVFTEEKFNEYFKLCINFVLNKLEEIQR